MQPSWQINRLFGDTPSLPFNPPSPHPAGCLLNPACHAPPPHSSPWGRVRASGPYPHLPPSPSLPSPQPSLVFQETPHTSSSTPARKPGYHGHITKGKAGGGRAPLPLSEIQPPPYKTRRPLPFLPPPQSPCPGSKDSPGVRSPGWLLSHSDSSPGLVWSRGCQSSAFMFWTNVP